MRKSLLFLMGLLVAAGMSAATKISVNRIDPTDWYVGMKNSQLQLMVYGEGIRDAEVTVNYAGVRVDSVVRLDSPNYLMVYLNLKGAQAGTMPLVFTKGKAKKTVDYVLKNREMSGDKRVGFSNYDVLYMLMPDRFASSGKYVEKAKQLKGKKIKNADDARLMSLNHYVVDRSQPSLRHGGDLEGIRQHLDYFNELGVTALWLTPVLENNSPDNEAGYSTYHGYATTDYYRVDPRFGTNADYRRLVDEAHQKGLKVVMDMIFNHCGFEHPWVADQPCKDWLNLPEWLVDSKGSSVPNAKFQQTSYKLTPVKDPYASEVDLKETVEGWFVPTMPDLNQRNPHVMTYLIQNSIWWIETVGIDGIRMDTYPYAFADGMAQWMKTIDEEYPNFNVVGETWVTEPAYTAAWQKGSKVADHESYLKTVMDFAFFDRLSLAKHEETDAWWNGFNRLYNSFCYDYLYPDPTHVMAFIDNHDTDRFLGNGHDSLAMKQALALLLTVRRIPQLYYGTEIMMNGTKEITDGNVRKDFPGGFPGDTRNAFTRAGRTAEENSMFDWLSRVLHWRNGNETIVRGYQTQFIPYNGVYVVARRWHRHVVMTIINGTSKPAKVEIKRYAELIEEQTEAEDITTGKTVSLKKDIPLSPRQTMILEF